HDQTYLNAWAKTYELEVEKINSPKIIPTKIYAEDNVTEMTLLSDNQFAMETTETSLIKIDLGKIFRIRYGFSFTNSYGISNIQFSPDDISDPSLVNFNNLPPGNEYYPTRGTSCIMNLNLQARWLLFQTDSSTNRWAEIGIFGDPSKFEFYNNDNLLTEEDGIPFLETTPILSNEDATYNIKIKNVDTTNDAQNCIVRFASDVDYFWFSLDNITFISCNGNEANIGTISANSFTDIYIKFNQDHTASLGKYRLDFIIEGDFEEVLD
ncbi:MAG: hypothetical protein ACTSQY_11315, partial [Candidatus Odinarchaeia archaeon]